MLVAPLAYAQPVSGKHQFRHKRDADLSKKPFDLNLLEKKYQKAGSFRADFQQTIVQSKLARTKSSEGELLIRKPNMIHWDTQKPRRNVLVSNGERIWHYTPGLTEDDQGQVKILPAKYIANHQIVKILQGKANIKASFDVFTEREEGKQIVLALEPKRSMGTLKQLKLKINKADYLIEEVRMNYTSGNHTTINLQNIALGDNLPLNKFHFTPPPGAEVIEEQK